MNGTREREREKRNMSILTPQFKIKHNLKQEEFARMADANFSEVNVQMKHVRVKILFLLVKKATEQRHSCWWESVTEWRYCSCWWENMTEWRYSCKWENTTEWKHSFFKRSVGSISSRSRTKQNIFNRNNLQSHRVSNIAILSWSFSKRSTWPIDGTPSIILSQSRPSSNGNKLDLLMLDSVVNKYAGLVSLFGKG